MIRVRVDLGQLGAQRASKRGDVIVLIDALRASATIAAALTIGVRRVIPVTTIEEAFNLRHLHGYSLAGEQGGAQVAGFDWGNSPTQLLTNAEKLKGQTLVLRTSNGTRCANVASQKEKVVILAGSLPNARSVVRASWQLAQKLRCDITLLAAGLDREDAVEDTFAAQWLLQKLATEFGAMPEGAAMKSIRAEDALAVFQTSEAGQRLRTLGYAADVAFCAQFDILDLVPTFVPGIGFVPLTLGVQGMAKVLAGGGGDQR